MQLELNERKVKITSVDPNRELHGEDPKPVCYLHFSTNLLADDLAMFHPTLRSALYSKAEAPDLAQQGQDGTGIRFPFLKLPLKWKDDCVGAQLTVHYGTTAKSHIVLPGCIVNHFQFTPLEGGTVTTGFMVTCHPDEGPLGRLAMMVGTEVVISIKPPAPGEGGDDATE